MTRRTYQWVGGFILLGTFAGLGAMANKDAPPARVVEPTALPVETMIISPIDSFAERRTYTGIIKAARSSELGFERTGRLIAAGVQEGDRVTAGQVLARLDARNLEAKQRELTARRSAAQALLDELIAGPRQETIAAARAQVRDLQAQLQLAQLRFRRSEALVEKKAISRDEYDDRSLGLQSSEAQLDAAQRRLDELEAGTRKEQIEAQRAVVAQLDAALHDVAIDIEDSTLVAPFAGSIAKRHVDEGTIIAPGTPVLRLVEDSSLEAWIGLPADTAAHLESDAVLEVQVSGRPYAAKLDTVLPELDAATRTRTAVFRLTVADDSVVPSQVARVDVSEPRDGGGYRLPTEALTRGSRGLWSVLVAENDAVAGNTVAARRDVELLHTEGESVIVRGTLQAGDRVIVSGTHRLVSGQIVQLTD